MSGRRDNFIDEFTRYFPQYHMAMAEDSRGGSDGEAISPMGFSVIAPTTTVGSWSFNYYEHEELPGNDPECYGTMASGNIMPDRLERARAHIIYAFGPFQAKVGDTIVVEMAEIFGLGVPGALKNAEYLQFLKSKNFRVPSPPPKPVLRVATSNHEVSLDWTPLSGGVNPETYTDANRGDTVQIPLRRVSPVQEHQGDRRPMDTARRVRRSQRDRLQHRSAVHLQGCGFAEQHGVLL